MEREQEEHASVQRPAGADREANEPLAQARQQAAWIAELPTDSLARVLAEAHQALLVGLGELLDVERRLRHTVGAPHERILAQLQEPTGSPAASGAFAAPDAPAPMRNRDLDRDDVDDSAREVVTKVFDVDGDSDGWADTFERPPPRIKAAGPPADQPPGPADPFWGAEHDQGGRRWMNWRIGVAVIVAFVVGGAVGAFVEHERVQKLGHKASAASTSTTSTTDVTAWFGGDQTPACPALQSWYQAYLKALAVPKGGEWASMQLALLDSNNTISAAYRALMPLTNQTGSTELNFLIATETTLHETITAAPSAEAYQAFSLALLKSSSPDRLQRDTTVLLTAALACPKG